MQTNTQQRGFTIIELLLAMTGIAFVLIFIVFAIMHATNLYTKGIAIRQINQSGRQLTEDISRAIRYSANPQVPTGKNRVCAGGRSYAWNSEGSTWRNTTTTGTEIGFVVVDNANLCVNPVANDINAASVREVIGNVVKLQTITIDQPLASVPIYNISVVLSTKGANEPTTSVVGGVTTYECSPIFGQYCAFGDFNTQVYARKGE